MGTALLFCSFLGIGMNWSGWNCRDKISAASYTLLGVACKFISVLLNVLIWDKHATQSGIACLIVCLLSSTFYKQAPLRGPGNGHQTHGNGSGATLGKVSESTNEQGTQDEEKELVRCTDQTQEAHKSVHSGRLQI